MRIGYLANARIPSRAANSVQIVKMCNAFSKNGHRVTLFSRYGDAPPESIQERYGVERSFEYVALRERGFRGTRVLNFLRDVRREVKARSPFDLYFARDVFGLALVARHGLPMIFEAHRSMRGKRMECLVFNWLCRRPNFEKIVVVSRGMMQEYLDLFPSIGERIQVQPGAADEIGGTDTPLQWPGRSGAIQMGYLGHLYPGRGIEVLIGIARSVPEADVHIVGGTDRDISAWRATQLPDNVFLHGYVPHSRVGAYLSRFDILAAPYQRQVFTDGGVETSTVMSPLKLFEYMACGKPILCSDLPVLREVLSPGEDALLVPPDDIRAWADAVRTLERDAELRTRLGSAARDKFLRKHTWVSRAAAVLSSKATSSNGN